MALNFTPQGEGDQEKDDDGVEDHRRDDGCYLVDPGLAGQYQQAFFARSQQVAQLSGTTIFTYDSALAAAIKAYQANHTDVRFGGYLGTEFRNVTFKGERAGAEETLARWQV